MLVRFVCSLGDAFCLAELAARLPQAAPHAPARVRWLTALAAEHGWSDATLTALVLRQVDWFAIGKACSLGEPAVRWMPAGELIAMIEPLVQGQVGCAARSAA